jgi:hypothetical protein
MTHPVIPAKAGIQRTSESGTEFGWIPAFAGMTDVAQ